VASNARDNINTDDDYVEVPRIAGGAGYLSYTGYYITDTTDKERPREERSGSGGASSGHVYQQQQQTGAQAGG
jgi:hypothetical protein